MAAMRIFLVTSVLLLHSRWACAGLPDFLSVFELEDGHTNWQYVANTSATVLILALSYTLVRLVLSHREAKRYNRELEAIRSQLEQRVQERTATLDESNRLLQESNRVLEVEIQEHRSTTERLRMSEAYVASILQSMPSMLIGLRQDGTVTQWNRRAQEISGLSAEAVLGQNLWQVYPMITVSPDQVRSAISGGEAVSVKQSQRGQFYFDLTIYPLQDQAETGVVVMIDDVTQRVLAENKLIQRDKMSSMGELAASMAHDIDVPLQRILAIVEDLYRQLADAPPEAQEAAGALLIDVHERGRQSSAVINNLLEFSSARVGEKKLANVTRIMDHSIQLAGTMLSVPSGLRFADVRIERDYGDDLPEVPCYIAELQQVFLSLFRHCCHALGDSGEISDPAITVHAHHYYDALWIKIQHNGRGISAEEQQFIFEPFFTEPTQSDNGDYDAGRRLSFPYFIITEQHRGQLAVTSDLGAGTTFHIQLNLE